MTEAQAQARLAAMTRPQTHRRLITLSINHADERGPVVVLLSFTMRLKAARYHDERCSRAVKRDEVDRTTRTGHRPLFLSDHQPRLAPVNLHTC